MRFVWKSILHIKRQTFFLLINKPTSCSFQRWNTSIKNAEKNMIKPSREEDRFESNIGYREKWQQFKQKIKSDFNLSKDVNATFEILLRQAIMLQAKTATAVDITLYSKNFRLLFKFALMFKVERSKITHAYIESMLKLCFKESLCEFHQLTTKKAKLEHLKQVSDFYSKDLLFREKFT